MSARDEQDWTEILGLDRLPHHIIGNVSRS